MRAVIPKLGDCLFVSLLAGALLLGPRMLNQDSDVGRHLTLGNYMLSAETIPVKDILSFTELGRSRPPYEWLSQVAFAVAYRVLNLDGVVLLAALAIAAAFLVVFIDSRERSRAPIVSLLITFWAVLASSLHWVTRPHVFSFLLFALWIRGLEGIRSGRSFRLWQFPVLMLIWANAHGGFVFGILAWAMYAAGWLYQALRKTASRPIGIKLLYVGTTALLASIVTPSIWGNWDAVLQNRSSFILSRTVETMPPSLAMPGTWPFWALLAMVVVLLVQRGQQLAPAHVFLLIGLSIMSVAMARNIPFMAIAAGPIVAVALARSLAARASWARVEHAILAIDAKAFGLLWSVLAVFAAACWLGLNMLSTRTPIYAFSPRVFPVAAVNWLEQHPISGHMFNDFNWGGYLLYRLWPQERVFMDSQSDFYGEALARTYEEIILGRPGWQQELNRYEIDWIIAPSTSGLSAQAADDPSWQLLYRDDLAVIFVRRQGP